MIQKNILRPNNLIWIKNITKQYNLFIKKRHQII